MFMGIEGENKSYKQKYNEEHYKQLNMRVPAELFERFNLKKENYGSAPKLLAAGLDAIDEVHNLKYQISAQNERIEDFRGKYRQLELEKEKIQKDYQKTDVDLLNMGIIDFIVFRYLGRVSK